MTHTLTKQVDLNEQGFAVLSADTHGGHASYLLGNEDGDTFTVTYQLGSFEVDRLDECFSQTIVMNDGTQFDVYTDGSDTVEFECGHYGINVEIDAS